MARLNTRPSERSSRYSSATPRPDIASDQENHDPRGGMRNKGKERATDPRRRTSLPTPSSEDSSETRGQKRKRGDARSSTHESEEEDEEEQEEKKFVRYFDPNQDPEERRDIKKQSRALERGFQENRDEILRGSGSELTKTIRDANKIYENVKQTNDATLDSRLLVNVSDLAYKKTAQLVLGDTATGVDVDEFLSKCLSYMRNGGPPERDQEENVPSSSRRRRTTTRNIDSDNEDDDIIGEPLDWEALGRYACFPYNARPCVPTFLLGPLSVEKKQRTQTQRRARQSKDTAGREARPEALSREDLSHSDENGLTATCQRINNHLNNHVSQGSQALEDAGFTSADQLKSQRGQTMLRKHRITDTGGVSLFDFVLNPRSFGQTVENLFYVSFLIKEGSFGIENDSSGLPTLMPTAPTTLEQQRKDKTSKHQAVFSLDYTTWRSLVDAFEVREPLIAHRQEEQNAAQMGQRGWYT